MDISLIITTYNWKEALGVSLASVLAQTLPPCEIIVADDGSRPDTGELVRRLAATAPVPVIHSWQEDLGFRLAMSRNRAIARARGAYIILIDGDIVVDRRFVEDHRDFARMGHFVQGTRVLLGPELTERVLASGELRRPLLARGVENRKNCVRSLLLARLFSFRSRRLPGVKHRPDNSPNRQ